MANKKVCSVFGHRNTEDTPELRAKLIETFKNLISDGTTTFLFGSRSNFDNICWEVVTELKEKYPDIKRVLIRAEYPYADKEYINAYLEYYEETYMPEKVKTAGRAAYVERNQWMIDHSDICVFYYDENYLPEKKKFSKNVLFPRQTKSGTKTAYEYAVKKKKRIFNIL